MTKIDRRNLEAKLKYEGKLFSSKSYGDFKVIEYITNNRVLVEFITTRYRKYVATKELLSGGVKDPYFPKIFGVAYCGEGCYPMSYYRQGVKFHAPAYEVWRSKLKNIYGSTKSSHLYMDVTFCKEWLNYQNFAKWFYAQVMLYGKGGSVDKDLLFLGNREYSPYTCAYIPSAVNSLFTGTSGKISGVHFDNSKKKWVAQIQNGMLCSNGNKRQTYLGMYIDKASADNAYYKAKLEHVKAVALKYQEQLPPALFYKLYTGSENYLNYYMFEKET